VTTKFWTNLEYEMADYFPKSHLLETIDGGMCALVTSLVHLKISIPT
jgi:hypothetical protein